MDETVDEMEIRRMTRPTKVGDHWEVKTNEAPSDAQAARRGPAARNKPMPTAGT